MHEFLREYQRAAVEMATNGCVFNGSTGSGKSRTGIYYYFKEQGGQIDDLGHYTKMTNPRDLYIITTAMKRDTKDFEEELSYFLISPNKELSMYDNLVVIDSWNNIERYKDVKDAFFIFDEQRVVGNGKWSKMFIRIAKQNNWIMLSATPGDKWTDYIPLFLANGFYKNRSQFTAEHIVFASWSKYPKIDRYVNVSKLVRLRNRILINMDSIRTTTPHHVDLKCHYDVHKYRTIMHDRWDPYKNEPFQQASAVCYALRRCVNEDESRIITLLDIMQDCPRCIIFYNFDYERDAILHCLSDLPDSEDWVSDDFEVAEWSGHAHQPVPETKSWAYLVQYTAGCEGWNCINTDTVIFYSQTYSYKVLTQACGRIDRMNTPYKDLYYYHLISNAGIDLAIKKALKEKKNFNELKYIGEKP